MEGWLACLEELSVLEDNPVWAKTTLTFEFPKLSMPYSPIILPDFNENEYVNRSNEDEDVPEPVPIPALVMAPNIEVANLAKEAEDTVADAFEERSVEEIEGDDGENADRDPIPKL